MIPKLHSYSHPSESPKTCNSSLSKFEREKGKGERGGGGGGGGGVDNSISNQSLNKLYQANRSVKIIS